MHQRDMNIRLMSFKARGIDVKTPRWTCVWGADEVPSSSAVWRVKPREIPQVLQELKQQVEKVTGEHFNFVLCNYYADGKDSISWHSDDEK
jgi:alkylated DNA repair dioxygenase AlkB